MVVVAARRRLGDAVGMARLLKVGQRRFKDIRHLEDGNREAPECTVACGIRQVDWLAQGDRLIVIRQVEWTLHGRYACVAAVTEALQTVGQGVEVHFPRACRIAGIDVRHAALRRQLDARDIGTCRHHLFGDVREVLGDRPRVGNHVGQRLGHRAARIEVLLQLVCIDLSGLRALFALHGLLVLHDMLEKQ